LIGNVGPGFDFFVVRKKLYKLLYLKLSIRKIYKRLRIKKLFMGSFYLRGKDNGKT